jgi:WD40 repeat protein
MPKAVPLVAPGHTRPVTHLSFSPLLDDGTYLLISSCKDGNPMLREWTGDWIGTFVGHKGAVWCTKLSRDASRAASGSADFTACVSPILYCMRTESVQSHSSASSPFVAVKFGIRTADRRFTPSRTITSSAVLRSPHRPRPRVCSLGDKKRRFGYSTLGNRMRSQTSYPRAVVNRHTMARSRACCGLTRILV